MDNCTCSIEGCDKPARGRVSAMRVCGMHWARWHKRGSFDLPERKLPTVEDRLARNTGISAFGCWRWLGTLDHYGYGQVNHGRTHFKAHRVAYETWVGKIPPKMVIDHICHNPACVRPEHLRAVTIKQNTENHSGPSRASKSGVRGVHKHSYGGRWAVQVTHKGHTYSGGLHKTLEAAEAAAISLRNKLHSHNDLDKAAS